MDQVLVTKKKKEWIFICAIFCISVIIRFIAGAFFKTIHVYYDDLTYYQMAESFANGQGFRINNIEWPYRILYSVFIAPSFLFKDRHVQIIAIQFINSVLISSTIFPYAVMASKILRTEKMRRLAYVFFLIYSDLCYSMTFMSENLLLPLGTWVVCITMLYVWDDTKSKYSIGKNPIRAAIIGLLLYLGYMTKGASIVLIPMTIGIICMDTLWKYITSKERYMIIRRLTDVIIIFVIFLLLKKLGDSNWMYLDENLIQGKQETVEAETIRLNIAAIIQCSIYLLVTSVISVGILPALLPLIYFRKLNKQNKKMYTFVFIMVGIGIVSIAWYNQLDTFDIYKLRPHFRYIIYIWLPAFLSFFSLMEEKLEGNKVKTTIGFFVPILLCAVLFRGIYDGSTVDQTMNYYIIKLFNENINVFRLLIIFVALFSVPLMLRFQKQTFIAFLIVFSGIQLINNALIIKYHRQDYYLSERIYEQIKPIEEKIKTDSTYNYLIVSGEPGKSEYQRLADTFFNMENVYTLYYDVYMDKMEKKSMQPSIDNMENVEGLIYRDIKELDYIILPVDTEYKWEEGMMTEVPGFENDYLKLYSLNDNKAMPIFYR